MIDERTAADLDRMLRATENALRFAVGMTEAELLEDAKTQAAVMMCLIILGEAARRISARSPDFVAEYAAWPWEEMRAPRNRTAHDYDTIDFRVVWVVLRDSLPALRQALRALALDPRERPED